MCFTNDYDWYASVWSDTKETAVDPRKCFECRAVIPVGAIARHIEMQEHEVCIHDPEHDSYEGPEDGREGCQCEPGECDFGESFECWICEPCGKLLEAIQAAELDAGCHLSESQPEFGGLHDAMSMDDQNHYRAKAAAMFPEIADHVAKYYPERNEDD